MASTMPPVRASTACGEKGLTFIELYAIMVIVVMGLIVIPTIISVQRSVKQARREKQHGRSDDTTSS